jgi:multicomponent K+:H+ antiporter subunit C
VELLVALAVGVLVGTGVYLVLRARTFPVILGLGMLGYAVNLFLFASGRLTVGSSPIVGPDQAEYPDPLPQALVLTAIVIGFGMTAFAVVLALVARVEVGTDHVDGVEPDEEEGGDEAAARAGAVAAGSSPEQDLSPGDGREPGGGAE